METSRWIGHWWLPEYPDDVVPGIMRRDESGRKTLELVGGFSMRFTAPDEHNLRSPKETDSFPIIVGKTHDDVLTLLDCYETSKRSHFTFSAGLAYKQQTFIINECLLGINLESVDKAAFSNVYYQIDNLAHVLSPLKTLVEIEDNGSTASLSEASPSEVEYDGLKFKGYLGTMGFYPHRFSNETHTRAQSTGYIKVASDEPISYEKIDRYSKAFLDLITVASGTASGLISSTLDNNIPGTNAVNVIGNPSYKATPEKLFEGWSNFLFTCDDLPVEVLIPRWLKLWTDLGPAVGILLGQSYSDASYLEEKELAVAVAAESFHTKLYDHVPRPQEEFDLLIENMIKGVPDKEDMNWIKNRFSNTLSFNSRIKDLLTKPDQRAVDMLLPDKKLWQKSLYQSRNAIAHGSGKNVGPSLVDRQITIRETKMLLCLVLMKELGISGDRQLEVIKREQLLPRSRARRK